MKKNYSSDDEQANILNEFNVFYDDDVVNLMTKETSWMINSGASIHVTSRKEFFSFYTLGNFGTSRIRNHNLVRVIGK